MSQCKPWWKEPWPWLLISGPALAMIGCAVTIWVAMQHADRLIVDGVVRQGLLVRQAAAPAAVAASAATQDSRDAVDPRSVARP
ncbi:FixH family protein [Cupriavidus gilardii]|uniref:FixH family protein n=1 Tax=Cupriavidus gilardii TaxID=82541 RepID=A0ABY4VW43_9BURK|nr:FixH family protein [Cupriavidus gilardii]USE81328.1 FixH family protein [Cupriavidus gilardii]